jgi:hypothetical protein
VRLKLAMLADCPTPDEPRCYARTITGSECEVLELDDNGWLIWQPVGKARRLVAPSLIRMVEPMHTDSYIYPPLPSTLPDETFEVIDRQAHYTNTADLDELEMRQPVVQPTVPAEPPTAPAKKRGRPRKQ